LRVVLDGYPSKRGSDPGGASNLLLSKYSHSIEVHPESDAMITEDIFLGYKAAGV